MSVCPKCKGRKYIELDKVGLLTAECDECKGVGIVEDTPTVITIDEEANDNSAGVEPDNQPTGKPDTGKPTVSKKPKARKKTRRKSR